MRVLKYVSGKFFPVAFARVMDMHACNVPPRRPFHAVRRRSSEATCALVSTSRVYAATLAASFFFFFFPRDSSLMVGTMTDEYASPPMARYSAMMNTAGDTSGASGRTPARGDVGYTSAARFCCAGKTRAHSVAQVCQTASVISSFTMPSSAGARVRPSPPPFAFTNA